MDKKRASINENEVWYRYSDRLTYDPTGVDHLVSSVSVQVLCTEYRVVRTTPCGVWLADAGAWRRCKSPPHDDRWVSTSAYKRWACPTREAAFESFIARKRSQIGKLEHQLVRARAALTIATTDGEGTLLMETISDRLE